MDINRLFKAGMNSCGRVLSILPEKEIVSPKQFMLDVLETETLPTLNDLIPVVYRTVLDTSMLTRIERENMTNYAGFRVPLELTKGLPMNGIRSVSTGTLGYNNSEIYRNNGIGYLGTSSWMSLHPNRFGRYSSANLYETVMSGLVSYADLQLLGSIQEAPIPRFEAPNIIWLNRLYGASKSFFAVLLLDNDPNLLTIPENSYEAVRRLFILDLRKTIYNRYGMLSNVDTVNGSLDLKIDDWSGAESERNELYEMYDQMSHIRKTTIVSG